MIRLLHIETNNQQGPIFQWTTVLASTSRHQLNGPPTLVGRQTLIDSGLN